MPALIEATRRQMESGDPKLHKATFAISLKTPGMIKFMKKYQASYMDEITASVQRIKDLSIDGSSRFRRKA